MTLRKALRLAARPFYALFSNRRFIDLFTYTPRELMMRTAMEFAMHSPLEDDHLEFGVNRRESFIFAYHFGQRSGLDSMRFFRCDSFQGLPRSILWKRFARRCANKTDLSVSDAPKYEG